MGRTVAAREEGAIALVTCPECGKQVSARASTCPGCGCPLGQGAPAPARAAPAEPPAAEPVDGDEEPDQPVPDAEEESDRRDRVRRGRTRGGRLYGGSGAPGRPVPRTSVGKIVGGCAVLCVLACAGLGGVVALLGGDGASKNAARSARESEPALDVSVSQLVAEYDANEVAADEKYKGRTVRIKGSVDDIKKDILDELYITLSSGHVLRSVQCYFDKAQTGTLAGLKKGARVTVVGRVDGLMMNVLVKDCRFE